MRVVVNVTHTTNELMNSFIPALIQTFPVNSSPFASVRTETKPWAFAACVAATCGKKYTPNQTR